MYGYEVLHPTVAESLIQNVRLGISQHAYIFAGERGVGSLECARLLAAALTCKRKESAPCGVCPACLMSKSGTHPDIYTLSPTDGKKNITVDQMRSVTTDAYTKPYESEKKVYIIAYGDDLNEQAQNAFLKVLEEPPEYAVFIILAENPESLLATIRSRCISIRFNPVGDKAIREYIEKHFPDAESTDFLVQYAGGIAGEIEKLLSHENFTVLRRSALDNIEKLLSKSLLDAYDIAAFIEENKEDSDLILRLWQGFLRDIMLIHSGKKDLVQSTDYIDMLINLSNKLDDKRVSLALSELITAQKMKKRYVNLRTLTLRLAFSIKTKGEKL